MNSVNRHAFGASNPASLAKWTPCRSLGLSRKISLITIWIPRFPTGKFHTPLWESVTESQAAHYSSTYAAREFQWSWKLLSLFITLYQMLSGGIRLYRAPSEAIGWCSTSSVCIRLHRTAFGCIGRHQTPSDGIWLGCRQTPSKAIIATLCRRK